MRTCVRTIAMTSANRSSCGSRPPKSLSAKDVCLNPSGVWKCAPAPLRLTELMPAHGRRWVPQGLTVTIPSMVSSRRTRNSTNQLKRPKPIAMAVASPAEARWLRSGCASNPSHVNAAAAAGSTTNAQPAARRYMPSRHTPRTVPRASSTALHDARVGLSRELIASNPRQPADHRSRRQRPPHPYLGRRGPGPGSVPDACPIGRQTPVSSGQPRCIGPAPASEPPGQVSGRITLRLFA